MTNVSASETLACPRCAEPIAAGDVFCEACGNQLPATAAPAPAAAPEPGSAPGPGDGPAPPCVSCGAEGEITDDGYCGVCGTKQPAPHDHEEHVVAGAAAVTDRGLQHARNEDAVALARRDDGRLVAVVCDGVSTTVDPDEASALAATMARDVLVAADLDAEGEPIAGALVAAYLAARDAVLGLAFTPDPELGPPSCTFLAAVVTPPDRVDLAGLGDCRAYVVDPDTGTETVLTTDDSWATEQVAAGLLPAEEAYADNRAHTLTRWIARDADLEWRPTIRHGTPGAGLLVLCSDGLWNYTLEPGQLAAAAKATDSGDGDGDQRLLAIARRLTAFANDQGGHDNITVVAADLPLPPTPT